MGGTAHAGQFETNFEAALARQLAQGTAGENPHA